VVIGHSMGGFVSIASAALHPAEVAGVVVVDSPVAEPDHEVEASRTKQAFGQPKVYPSVDDALTHFRTVPPQEHYLPYVMHHVARRSLVAVDDGFSWKFDPNLFNAFPTSIRAVALPYLPQVQSRFALLRAEHGLVTPDIGESMYEMLGRAAPVVEIPEAGHHPMLDEPLVLTTAIRTLLADWDHSTPRKPRG
jgi:pimeloyl-ACP methyl ester carboxylesterase